MARSTPGRTAVTRTSSSLGTICLSSNRNRTNHSGRAIKGIELSLTAGASSLISLGGRSISHSASSGTTWLIFELGIHHHLENHDPNQDQG